MRGLNITITKNAHYRGLLLFLLVTSFAFMFLNFKGTDDRKNWLRWTSETREKGLINGYRSGSSIYPYPPLTFAILDVTVGAASKVGLPDLEGIKVSLFLCLVATALVFYAYTRNIMLATMLQLALLLNSVVLAYTDVYFAPFLILALWALQKQKVALFTLLFAVACLIKWQPLVLTPFFVFYILNISSVKDVRAIEWKGVLIGLVGPVALVLVAIMATFGLFPVLASLQQALTYPFLSAQALNFNWVVNYVLNVLDPSIYGHLANGVSPSFVKVQDGFLSMLIRPLFWVVFAFIVVLWFRAAKTFENLLLYSLLGYLTYFMLGVGAHENHLYIAIILAAMLAYANKEYLPLFLTWALVANINLFIFYGIDGRALPFSRIVWGFDTSVLLAFVNVMLFVAFFVGVVAPGRLTIDD